MGGAEEKVTQVPFVNLLLNYIYLSTIIDFIVILIQQLHLINSQSFSLYIHMFIQLPMLASPSAAATTEPSSSIKPLLRRRATVAGDHQSATNLPSLIWKPVDSQRQIPFLSNSAENGAGRGEGKYQLESGSLGSFLRPPAQRRHSDITNNSSLMHYKNVKRLVEQTQRGRLPAIQPHPTHPHMMGVTGQTPLPLPVGLPPKLCQYINEIWQKHSRTL